ncbi:hypothetical protein ACI2OX_13115 [Bacillus sp. N9]
MGDNVKIVLTDGKELAPANVSELTDIAAETPLIQASLMIGKQISWLSNDREYSSIVKSVSMKDGFVTLMTDGGLEVKSSQLIKIG